MKMQAAARFLILHKAEYRAEYRTTLTSFHEVIGLEDFYMTNWAFYNLIH